MGGRQFYVGVRWVSWLIGVGALLVTVRAHAQSAETSAQALPDSLARHSAAVKLF